MNLLAHLHLSFGQEPDTLTANVLADYLTRYEPVERMPVKLRDRFMPGIILHRKIDSFTDQHEVVARARGLISGERRRLAGIIVDIVFDFYLSKNWGRFSGEPQELTVSRGYATMSMVAATGLGEATQNLVSRMRRTDWLNAYGTLEGQATTFRRVSRRSPSLEKLRGSEDEILMSGPGLERCFLEFYPQLMRHVGIPGSEQNSGSACRP